MQSLFEKFKREKQFLKGVAPKTLIAYSQAWDAFIKHHGLNPPTQASVEEFMVAMLESGLSPGAANCYARSINSFLSWLHEKKETPERFRVPLTKMTRRVLKTYTEDDAQKIVRHRPVTRTGKRLLALLSLLIDTGARVDEALTLTRKNVDFDNWLVTLYGKGGKERIVPISPECSRDLYRWLQTHEHELVFCSSDGKKLRYDNLRRDLLNLLEAAGVEKSEGSFHAFRRYFGKAYLKKGGNPLRLQRLFGHETMDMTRRYVAEDLEDLRDAHRTLSPLEGLKKR